MAMGGASELTMSQWSSFFAQQGTGVSKELGDLLETPVALTAPGDLTEAGTLERLVQHDQGRPFGHEPGAPLRGAPRRATRPSRSPGTPA